MSHRRRISTGLVAVCLLAAGCGVDDERAATVGVGAPAASSSVAEPTASTTTGAGTGPTATASPAPTIVTTVPPMSAPATAAPVTTTIDETIESNCRRITEFDEPEGWVVVNDGVMGGRSDGRVEIADSEMRFTGDVVTQGGGFTSVRRQLAGDELAGTDRIVMRVWADDRTYGLTMEDAAGSGRRPVSHRADLTIDAPADGDGWSVVTLPYAALEPRIFGQPIDADAFDPDTAAEIGIIIADGRDGEFELTVDWIDACR